MRANFNRTWYWICRVWARRWTHVLWNKRDPNKPLDPRIIEAGKRVKEACEKNGKYFLGGGTPDNINNKIDEGVHIISGEDKILLKLVANIQKGKCQ